jgi:HK97 gp10 family phage protein
MKVEAKIEGLNGVLETLKQLPPEVVSKNGGPVRSALRKGALIILAQAKTNLQNVTRAADADKQYSTGHLLANLVAQRAKPPSGMNGEAYRIRVRSKRAYARKGIPVTAWKTGYSLEYGTVKQKAEPWLRPAAESRYQEAMQTIKSELIKGIDRVQKKLARENKGKK